jgi:hypothetical protein
MAWAQFLYAADVIVKVSRLNGAAISTSNVVLRPSNLTYTIRSVGGAALITVPYTQYGTRFSIKLQDGLWTYRNAGLGKNSYYVQNVDPEGPGYVSAYTDNMPIDGQEMPC